MPTLFTRIISGDLPARFVWADDVAVAFLSIGPITRRHTLVGPRQEADPRLRPQAPRAGPHPPGHAVVVPRQEGDQGLDADDALLAHLLSVAKRIGAAQVDEWDAP